MAEISGLLRGVPRRADVAGRRPPRVHRRGRDRVPRRSRGGARGSALDALPHAVRSAPERAPVARPGVPPRRADAGGARHGRSGGVTDARGGSSGSASSAGSIGLAAAGRGRRGLGLRPRSGRLPRRPRARGARLGSRTRSRTRLPTSTLAVVCGPVVQPAGAGRAGRSRRPGSGARSPTSARRSRAWSRRSGRRRGSWAAIRCAAPRLGGSRTRGATCSRARPGFSLPSRPPTPPITAPCTASSPASAHVPSRSTRVPTTAWWRSPAICRMRSRTSS